MLFAQDGDYTLSVQYTDLAGNAAVPYEGPEFTIDRTPPEIHFTPQIDGTINTGIIQRDRVHGQQL